MNALPDVMVTDDAALPTLGAALDPDQAAAAFAVVEAFAGATVRVRAASLLRHKPGRRAVIAYDLRVTRDGHETPVAAIGKMRARRYAGHALRLLRELHDRGFDAASADGIAVPEPLGLARPLNLWLQRRAEGLEATVALRDPAAAAPLATRLAAALHKLHRTPATTRRAHGPDDELAILARVFDVVAAQAPAWRARLAALLEAGRGLVARLPHAPVTAIHRDFYGDQVLVHGDRLTLLDFDLYCEGPAALDAGNFLGHLAEQAVREPAHAVALSRAEAALEQAYLDLVGEAQRAPVRVYTALTVARHVYLSHVIPGRLSTAPAVFDVAEARMEAARHAF